MTPGTVGHQSYRIAVVPGDGIGPEVIRQGMKVLGAVLEKAQAPECLFTEVPAGAELYRQTGVAFPKESRRICYEADAIYLGATGLPDVHLPDGTGVSVAWDLRRELDLYAAVRPLFLFNERLCPLKGVRAEEIRLTIVRENTEGIYASRHAGTTLHGEVAVNPIVITRKGSERIMRFAFAQARKGRGAPADGLRRVTCVDKSNVLGAWAFFRKIFEEVGIGYPDVEKERIYIDAVTLLLIRQPSHYNVLVTENQHGDILSDLCAALVGGLGFAPSANIGDGKAMFEPSHGTAPTIAGKGLANPVAAILSGGMMLRWLGEERGDGRLTGAADRIDQAVEVVLRKGDILTPDGGGTADTDQLGDAIVRALDEEPPAD